MSSMRRLGLLALLAGASLLSSCSGCGDEEPPPPTENDRAGRHVVVHAQAPVISPLLPTTTGTAGGTLTTSGVDPLAGVRITVPPGAATETLTFELSSAAISSIEGLPEGTEVIGPLIRVRASGSAAWNARPHFLRPVSVTLPYPAPASGEDAVNFYEIDADGHVHAAGFVERDPVAHTITFLTGRLGDEPRTAGQALRLDAAEGPNDLFVTYVAIGASRVLEALADGAYSIDSGFRPETDGFYVPNYGSYLKPSRGGNCMGMVYYARWHYQNATGLYASYRDPEDTATWVDDAVAIELASRAHEAEVALSDARFDKEWGFQHPTASSQRQVALSYLAGLYVTGSPVLLGIFQRMTVTDATGTRWINAGGHEIMAYSADIAESGRVTFHLYDPNFPYRAATPATSDRTLLYSVLGGFTSYLSGTDAASSGFKYNYFEHDGYRLFGSDATFSRIHDGADGGFADASVFPKITLTKLSEKTSGDELALASDTTSAGEPYYETDEAVLRLDATAIGGRADSPLSRAWIFVGDKLYWTPIQTNGAFAAELPLRTGLNELVILAAGTDSYLSEWAGFHRLIVKSTAARGDLTITLTWGQDSSDVDLYVEEPAETAGAGRRGDVVYYQNKRNSQTEHPYLDVDNTRGLGPEHYYARSGMTTLFADKTPSPEGLYGTYYVRAHYYADHDDDPDRDQAISLRLDYRYLAFCPIEETDCEARGIWHEGSFADGLSAASSGNCCSIDHDGPDWTSTYRIDYERPDPSDFSVPDPPGVMLP